MFLASAISQCEDKMICDLAETYHVYNYRGLSASMLATLVFGLHDDSRTKLHLSGEQIDLNTSLLALCADMLSFLAWTKTIDAEKGQKRPKSILDALTKQGGENDVEGFTSADDFESAWNRMRGA